MTVPLRVDSEQNRKRGRILAAAIVGLTMLALLLAFLFIPSFGTATLYRVPTDAMAPTLITGDQIYATSLLYFFFKLRRGDIVLFSTVDLVASSSDARAPIFVKRIVGLSGEKISIRDGEFVANDVIPVELHGRKYFPAPNGHYLYANGGFTIVPNDSIFVIGDNSQSSYDSRYWGAVPKRITLRRAIFRYWPASRIGFLR